MSKIDLGKLYTPQPRQELLHATTANEILYGGAAGGGKSFSLRWDAYEFCLQNPGCIAVIVRQTLPQLEKNHIRWVRKEIPKALGSYNETKKSLVFWNGSILSFQHLEYDKDINDFQGDEIYWLGLDEAALLHPHHIAEVKSRLRLGNWKPQTEAAKKRLPRLVMTSNPGGPSHLYLKEGWIDPAPSETLFNVSVKVRNRTISKSRIFIPATMDDNAFLDEDYEAQFADMPAWKIKQFVDGDWNVVPGAYFDCWDSEKHIIKPFALPRWWPVYRSCDWGFSSPFSIGEWTISDGTMVTQKDGSSIRHPDGALIRIWEWYGTGEKRNSGLKMDGQLVAEQIIAARGKCKPGPADPSMWRADHGPSQAERFYRGGLRFFKADNQREPGWQEMYRRLNRGLLLVVEDCRDFIRTVPTASSDPMNPDDVLKAGEDHVMDDTRYMCMARPVKGKVEEPVVPIDAPMRYCHLAEIGEKEHQWI